jgi:hypothetical protein
MPLTGTKGYDKKQVTDTGKKVVDVASGATPATAVVRGGRAAAKWALDKYRAYTKSRQAKTAADAKKKAAAEKAKNEARADELYGKGTAIKPEPAKPAKPAPKPKTQPVAAQDMKSTLEKIRENKRRRAQQLKGT